ncbi:hypothetical protein KL930_000064 [Ogataea haglerorum]|uniref:glutathione-specific gamma-glutamylcyclotransferase n=1 Tax=Ogataea haglerorum TaxID=1937702 RepID=A0ABQ7RE87_9ASCO|nr:uncharacterized protein KL911_001070 [Ogataea haglerorum]KAG7697881.1 hypothetical protein KL951_002455 [Ogataea haglerorum]KAG7701482.1 hypothetical protein KL915_000513 [Ogataea haglerorum]KAG7706701.1 hypothetical protein KL950_003366 [Ogataea haglerorum]KAG7709441.1 hypothetical protein KL914_001831 [Ogataea haglerorum]KAG7717695.1 hypothetical protein KL913_002631 [Ogataea haglerorum]
MTRDSPLWVVGYGSLLWKPPLHELDISREFVRFPGYIQGYARRFWQSSYDNRGTPEQKGRVVTIIPSDQIVGTPAFKPDVLRYELAGNADAQEIINDSARLYSELRVWGCIYYIPPQYAAMATKYLDFREKDGYTIHKIHFNVTDPCGHEDVLQGLPCENGRYIVESMIYIGTADNESFVGPEDVEETARVIRKSAGESGPNDEYLLLLHHEVEKMGGDPYLEDLVTPAPDIFAALRHSLVAKHVLPTLQHAAQTGFILLLLLCLDVASNATGIWNSSKETVQRGCYMADHDIWNHRRRVPGRWTSAPLLRAAQEKRPRRRN